MQHVAGLLPKYIIIVRRATDENCRRRTMGRLAHSYERHATSSSQQNQFLIPNPAQWARHVAVLGFCRNRDQTAEALNRSYLLRQEPKSKGM